MWAFAGLKYALLPDVEVPVVVVLASHPARNAETTERELTIPLERTFAPTGTEQQASTTFPGRTLLRLTYHFGHDLAERTAQARELVRTSAVPAGTTFDVIPIDVNQTVVAAYALSNADARKAEAIAAAVRRVPGVANVEVVGIAGSGVARLNADRIVALRIVKDAGANELEVAHDADAGIRAAASHAGVVLTPVISQAPYISEASRATTEALVGAMLVAALVTFPFWRDWRATAIAALAIPTSLAGAALAMRAAGFDLEMITLVALTLVTGVIVDDAIVDVENIKRHLEEGATPHDAAVQATDEIGLTVTAATLAIVAVFVPVAFAHGNLGQFTRPFGLTAAAAVLVSLAVARTLSPMLAARWLRAGRNGARPLAKLEGRYVNLLRGVVAHPRRAALAALATVLVGIALVPLTPKGFIPHLNRGEFVVYADAPLGASAREMDAAVRPLEAALKRDRDVAAVLTLAGTHDDPSRAVLHVALLANRQSTTSEVEERVRGALPAVPGYAVSVEDLPFVDRGLPEPVRLIVTDPSQAVVERESRALAQALGRERGFLGVRRTTTSALLGVTVRIERVEGRYAAYVDADLTNDTAVGDATARGSALAARVLAPTSQLRLGGQSQSVTNALREMLTALVVAFVCVAVVLFALFRNVRAPLVVVSALPLSIAGAFGALCIFRAELGVVSSIALIFLLGLSAKNAIILVDAIEQRRRAGMTPADAVLEAGRVRLRPIVVTTVATIVGMLPIALGLGAGAELRAPMAIAIIGGLTTSAVLTLISVPAVYLLTAGGDSRVRG